MFACQLQAMAMQSDFSQHLAGEQKTIPVRPPLALPAPSVTDFDHTMLHDFGISEEDAV